MESESESSKVVKEMIKSIDDKSNCTSHEEWLQREAMRLLNEEAKFLSSKKKNSSQTYNTG